MMMQWIKRHPILTFLFLLFIVMPTTLGALNYSGFCVSEGRWLSDEEKIRKVIESIIENRRIPVEISGFGTKYFEQVKIANVEDFIKMNPDCCHVNPGTGPYDLPPPSFIDRITGYNSAEPIEVQYKTYYIDEKGIKVSQKYKYVTILKNCGN